MNYKLYMRLRLIFPLLAILVGIFFKDTRFFANGFAFGYLLCWIFSYVMFIELSKKEEKEK